MTTKNKDSGRPRKSPEHKRVSLSIRVHPSTQSWLINTAEKNGMSLGEIIDRLVDDRRLQHVDYARARPILDFS